MSHSLADLNPGGCFLGFNGMIDRKSAEQLVNLCGDAIANGFDEVTLCIGSLGGYLNDAYYACAMLDALPVRFVTHNVSTVQSAANMIFLCGDERFATKGATFFFHKTAFDSVAGQRVTEAFAAERLKAIQLDDLRSAQIIADKCAQTVERVREWQNAELVMNTDEAMAHGLIQAVKPLIIPRNAIFRQIVLQG